jgi:hypothetical protein
MKIMGWILCAFSFTLTSACNFSRFQGTVPSEKAQEFRIAEVQNNSTAKKRRFVVKIVLPSHYRENAVRSTLATIANTLNEPESEITMLFYAPQANLAGPHDVARVIWKNNRLDAIDYRPPALAGPK